MLSVLDKGKVIGMKLSGMSNRAINRKLGYDRDKISEVWSEYNAALARMNDPGADIKAIQDEMCSDPKYDSSKRTKRKYTSEVDAALKEILEQEEAKTRRLGPRHKQKLTNKQIHEQLVSQGHDIGRVTINNAIARLRKKLREVYIRQHYDYGDRLEYDFGEVTLDCGKGIRPYHMAIFSSPASNFKWAYLYTNQKQAVFQDSHVRFFEMMGGVWKEVVYDNMRNVVNKFIGKNEKELNRELIQMAMYYGFTPNVTNCFKANEKGHVESSVQILRNQIFAARYKFSSLDEASAYMTRRLEEINKEESIAKDGDDESIAKDGKDGNINISQDIMADTVRAKDAINDSDSIWFDRVNSDNSWADGTEVSDENRPENCASLENRPENCAITDIKIFTSSKGCTITEEKKHLLPYRPPLELAIISENTVDSYSMITIDTCKYSVPEYFVGKKVTVKKYHDEIRVYAKGSHARDSIGIDADNMICSHKRIFGAGNMSVDIYHYLGTLLRKPGAVRNSVALKSIPKLKAIFDTHYAKEPKKFIEIFIEHKGLSVDEIMLLFEEKTSNKETMRAEMKAISVTGKPSSADVVIRADMVKYTALIYNAGIGRKEVAAGIECKVARDGVVENTMDNYVENDRIFNPPLSLPPLSATPVPPPPTSSLSPLAPSSSSSFASSASLLSTLPSPPSPTRREVVAHASNS